MLQIDLNVSLENEGHHLQKLVLLSRSVSHLSDVLPFVVLQCLLYLLCVYVFEFLLRLMRKLTSFIWL
jgi:hypothetical protein